MKLVIDRQKWLRSEGAANSYLLRKSDGKQCCVGIYAEACGVSRTELEGVRCAAWITTIPGQMAWLRESEFESPDFDSPDAYRLYHSNDSVTISELKRETEIAAEFAKHGVEVEFIN